MLKPDIRKARKKAYELPTLAVGDVLLVGKFKNRKATITGSVQMKTISLWHKPTKATTGSLIRGSQN